MDKKISLYLELADLFESNNYSLYMVGGTVRDYLLNLPLTDMDLVTDATPEEMKKFLKGADYTYSKYGSVKLVYKDVKFDITTLRKEEGYSDFRHPGKIIFTKKLEEDVDRRDLTINSLYIDKDLEVIDYVKGVIDLHDKVLRMNGDPLTRLEEDPLRIVRIFRFSLELSFEIEESLRKTMSEHMDLLEKLNPQKIEMEISKSNHKNELVKLLHLNIK